MILTQKKRLVTAAVTVPMAAGLATSRSFDLTNALFEGANAMVAIMAMLAAATMSYISYTDSGKRRNLSEILTMSFMNVDLLVGAASSGASGLLTWLYGDKVFSYLGLQLLPEDQRLAFTLLCAALAGAASFIWSKNFGRSLGYSRAWAGTALGLAAAGLSYNYDQLVLESFPDDLDWIFDILGDYGREARAIIAFLVVYGITGNFFSEFVVNLSNKAKRRARQTAEYLTPSDLNTVLAYLAATAASCFVYLNGDDFLPDQVQEFLEMYIYPHLGAEAGEAALAVFVGAIAYFITTYLASMAASTARKARRAMQEVSPVLCVLSALVAGFGLYFFGPDLDTVLSYLPEAILDSEAVQFLLQYPESTRLVGSVLAGLGAAAATCYAGQVIQQSDSQCARTLRSTDKRGILSAVVAAVAASEASRHFDLMHHVPSELLENPMVRHAFPYVINAVVAAAAYRSNKIARQMEGSFNFERLVLVVGAGASAFAAAWFGVEYVLPDGHGDLAPVSRTALSAVAGLVASLVAPTLDLGLDMDHGDNGTLDIAFLSDPMVNRLTLMLTSWAVPLASLVATTVSEQYLEDLDATSRLAISVAGAAVGLALNLIAAMSIGNPSYRINMVVYLPIVAAAWSVIIAVAYEYSQMALEALSFELFLSLAMAGVVTSFYGLYFGSEVTQRAKLSRKVSQASTAPIQIWFESN